MNDWWLDAMLMGMSAMLRQFSFSEDLPLPSKSPGLCPEENGEPRKGSQQGMNVRGKRM